MQRAYLNIALFAVFASLAVPASSGAEAWTTFTARDDGFSIEVPVEMKLDKPGLYSLTAGLWSFSILVQTPGPEILRYVTGRNRDAAMTCLEGVRNSSVSVMNGKLKKTTHGELNGYPSLRYSYEATAEDIEMEGVNLVVLTDEHMYLLMTVAPKVAPNPHLERVLGSFRVLKASTDRAVNRPRATPSSTNPIASKLVGPMLALARLVVVDKANPLIDHMVQNAPVAEGLGSRWRPSHAAWPKARSAVSSRVTRIADLYEQSGDIVEIIESELGRLSASEGKEVAATLNGEAGPAILRSLALSTFVVRAMGDDPDGPSPGARAWGERMRALEKVFDEQVGPAMPPYDGKHAAAVDKYASSPTRTPLAALCDSVIDKVTVKVHGAVRLALFDDREAIWREIKAAIADTK